MSEWLVSFATETSLPFWSFISAGIVNLFVPSGGGQWAVQAPSCCPRRSTGADISRVAMAVAWVMPGPTCCSRSGHCGARHCGPESQGYMGFCLIQLFITGAIISVGLVWF